MKIPSHLYLEHKLMSLVHDKNFCHNLCKPPKLGYCKDLRQKHHYSIL